MQLVLPDLLSLCADAESAADRYETEAREAVRKLIAPMGKVDAKLLEREQFAAHGFAWIATYVSARPMRWLCRSRGRNSMSSRANSAPCSFPTRSRATRKPVAS